VKVDQIATGFQFTEGPLWNNRDKTLIFSDVRGRTMHLWSEGDGSARVIREAGANGISNGNTWDKEGNLLTCEHANRRVSRTLPDGTIETVVSHFGQARFHSPNDVITALNGDILFTDPPYGLRQPDRTYAGMEYPTQNVFRYQPDSGTLQTLVDDLDKPNGLVLTDDGSTLYIADTERNLIRVYDVQPDGNLANGRDFCTLVHGEALGRPDGMKLDSRGNLYVAANSPEGIWVYDPQGTLLGFIGLGEGPANLTWGGDDWQTMYVTAVTSVYRLRTKIPGQPVRFAPK
jgi:gluconolactonase